MAHITRRFLAAATPGIHLRAAWATTTPVTRRWNATATPIDVSITAKGLKLKALTTSQKSKRNVLPHIWLRDNCRCVECVNQDTAQRNFNTFEIPKEIRPLEATIQGDNLHVTWDYKNHKSVYPLEFIRHYLYNNKRRDEQITELWGASIAEAPPTISFKRVMDTSSEEGIGELTSLIKTYGFAFVSDTPVSPEETEKLLRRIAFIRVTHYGGFYDFIPDLALADTAYTNLALPAHTDTTYFSEPAGLQAFHLLSHQPAPNATAAAAEGGKSLLVDGFKAAQVLSNTNPQAFHTLSTVGLPFHASGNKGITIAPDRLYPVIERGDGYQRVRRVRWNNDDRGVVPFETGQVSNVEWYDAARAWDAILRSDEMEYWVQLTPGTTLIFDNWRVLHGRSAFEGIRRICGGYINRDDFISRWRNTNFPREQVLSKVVGF